MKCPFCKEFRGNSKVRGYPVKEQLNRHIEIKHQDKLNKPEGGIMAETKAQATKEAQELADLYHSPYYVCRGRFTRYTVSPIAKRGRFEVLPTDGKILHTILLLRR